MSGSRPEIRRAYQIRHLIQQLVRRYVLTRYKQSVLGIDWTLLNPLGMMVVLTIAFSQIFRFGDIRNYPTYVLSGLLAWIFFQQITTPSIVNLVLSFLLLALVMLATGVRSRLQSWSCLRLPDWIEALRLAMEWR